MNDTSSQVEARLNALFAQRSASDRVLMICEMFDFARSLLVGSITAAQPDITAMELRVQVFERTYGHDLDSATRRRVIARLRGEPPSVQS